MSERGTKLTSHLVAGETNALEVIVLDQPGSGGANHLYMITGLDGTPWMLDAMREADAAGLLPAGNATVVFFQNGPVPEHGINGVTIEALLAIVIDRLEGFQGGAFANDYNARALNFAQAAQNALKGRTAARLAQGVEGTLKVAPEGLAAAASVNLFAKGMTAYLRSGSPTLTVSSSSIDALGREHVTVTWRTDEGVAQVGTYDAAVLTYLDPSASAGGTE